MEALKVKNLSDTKAELYIYGDIVSSEWDRWQSEDVAPESVRMFLDEIKGKDLTIYINSGGGSVFAGLSIYHQLKRHQGKKTVHVDGIAASIASIIALAGDEVIIPKNSFLMIHKPWVATMGNSNDLRKMADDLDRIQEGIMNVYEGSLKDGVDIQTIQDMVDAETWLTGEDAAKYFNITVTESLDAVACVSDMYKNYASTPDDLVKEVLPEPEATIEDEPEVEIENAGAKEDQLPDGNKSELEDLLMLIDLL